MAWGFIFLAGLLVAYWPAVGAGFIWDDDAYVTSNPMLTEADGWLRIWFSAHKQSQFFPLTFTTLRFEHALWGLHPSGYHLVNILMHGANAMLAWVILKRLAVPGAWIAAGLFAFHPVEVQSVAWVSELKNTQSTLFYLLALLMWLRFLRGDGRAGNEDEDRRRSWGYYGLTMFFYLASLLSKTTACTLPAALLLASWIQGERIGRRRLAQIVPFVILGIAAGATSIWWEAHLGNYQEDVGQNLTLIQRTLIASHALWFYAGKLIWPADLSFSYPHWEARASDPREYGWVAGCLAVTLALWHWRKALGRRFIAAVVFFVAALAPLLGFIPLYTFRYSYVADHYQYGASLGLLALAAAWLSRAPRIFSIILIATLAGMTWNLTHIYRDPMVLWEDTLTKNPGSWMADNNLGLVYKDEGNYNQAIHYYEKALRLKPDYGEGHYNLGIALFRTGVTNEAMREFREAIRLSPRDCRAYYNYAVALDEGGQTAQAITEYEKAIDLNPDYGDARINLGILLSSEGRVDEAIEQFEEAVRLAPGDGEAHNNLGAVLRAKGRLGEAIEQFQEAIGLDPGYALAHANLGAALVQNGQRNEGISELWKAVRLDPDDANARKELALALGGGKDSQ